MITSMKVFPVTLSIFFYLLLSSCRCSSFISPHHRTLVSSLSPEVREYKPTANTLLYAASAPTPSSSAHIVRSNTNNDNNINKKKTGLESLSVTELKKLLIDRNVDFRDCLEKRDLIERLESTQSSAASSSTMDTSLTEEENRVIRTFKRVSPSVAFIQTTSVVQTIQGLRLKGMEVPSGTGSGFLWDDQGHVVTNYHVIAGGRRNQPPSNRMKVKLPNMAEARDAIVVGYEPEKDLAVLKLMNTEQLPKPIDIGSSSHLQVGQSVLAIGNPYGLDDTLTTGVVSALGREVEGFGGRPIKGCIQTDAAINPGNSGGPLLDSSGRLIGVNTAIFSPNGGRAGNVGIGFAIPVDTVRRVVNQIIRYGKVVRPSIGINVIDDRMTRSIEMQMNKKLEGVLIADVIPGSPAEKIGLKPLQALSDGSIRLGDLITDVDGQPVRQVEDLLSAIEERKEGEVVTLRIIRNGDPRQSQAINVKLTTRDKLENTSFE